MAEMNCDVLAELLQDVFADRDGLKAVVECLANVVMREEVRRHLRAERHERTAARIGHRNGHKPRRIKTRVGELALSVPQVRGCEPYHPSMFAQFQRSERALLVACGEMYFQGVSTRNVRAVLEQMCGTEISSATVSRVAQELDEKLATFRCRQLDGTGWPYVLIDARYEKVRVDGAVVSQAVLVAVGVSSEGRREVLDWRVADSESEESWKEMFQGLKDRGLKGVKLVVSDAHGGIVAAMRRHFQGASWQRCRVHFKRELGRKVSYKVRKEAMRELTVVFAPQEKSECLLRAEEMAGRWEDRYPKVAKMLREGTEDCLAVLGFPSQHRRRLQSTNMLENLMKRLKKRSQVVGVFPSRSSCDRLLGAQLVEVHEGWCVEGKVYLGMEQEGQSKAAPAERAAAA